MTPDDAEIQRRIAQLPKRLQAIVQEALRDPQCALRRALDRLAEPESNTPPPVPAQPEPGGLYSFLSYLKSLSPVELAGLCRGGRYWSMRPEEKKYVKSILGARPWQFQGLSDSVFRDELARRKIQVGERKP